MDWTEWGKRDSFSFVKTQQQQRGKRAKERSGMKREKTQVKSERGVHFIYPLSLVHLFFCSSLTILSGELLSEGWVKGTEVKNDRTPFTSLHFSSLLSSHLGIACQVQLILTGNTRESFVCSFPSFFLSISLHCNESTNEVKWKKWRKRKRISCARWVVCFGFPLLLFGSRFLFVSL